jgi:phenylalanyl-tRNA synthetase alpha chain
MRRYKLTAEGRKYLEKGLPELNLARSLRKPMSIQDAKNKIDSFNIALQWAKKNGWIKIDAGKIILVHEPKTVPEQDALKKISEGQDVSSDMLLSLERRNLIEEEREDPTKRAQKYIQNNATIDNIPPELIKTGLWRKAKLRPYNVKVTGKTLFIGKRQPYNQFMLSVRKKLIELGFKEMKGSLIETEFWNFDALFQPQNHPSRDWTQTYSLKNPRHGDLPGKRLVENVKASHENGWKTGSSGWGYKWDPRKAAQLMPRAHGTASSARQLASGIEIPGKYFAIARCFRPDVIDATHGVEFNQTEGIVIDDSLTFRNLLGILKQFAHEFAGAEKIKFLPDYYPFTEPSVQMSAKHPDLGWIEFGGAGIFRPELTEPLGVKQPVIAWGIGVDRLAMFRLELKDIRELFSQNLKWLREQRMVF